MSPHRDTSWHARFLRLVTNGLTFTQAVGKVGVAPATLSNHFRADPAFRDKAKERRGRWLHGPPPDTGWHPRLPSLLASGLSIPQAAAQLGVSAVTVRAHLRRFEHLRAAVVMAQLERRHPGVSRLTWFLEGSGVLALPIATSPARQEAAVRRWADALGLPAEARDGGLSVAIALDSVLVRISTSVKVDIGARAPSSGGMHISGEAVGE